MQLSSEAESLFKSTQLFCMNICSSSNDADVLQCVHSLVSAVQSQRDSSPSCVPELESHFLFPVLLLLKSRRLRSERAKCEVLSYLRLLLSLCSVSQDSVFVQFFSALFQWINPQPGQPPQADSEELQIAVLQTSESLYRSAPACVLVRFLSDQGNLPLLGHAVSSILKLTSERGVVGSALSCLSTILLTGRTEAELKDHGSRCLAFFLPGICSKLSDILTAGNKSPEPIKTAALELWTNSLILILGDQVIESTKREVADNSDSKVIQHGELLISKSPRWLKETSVKVALLLSQKVKDVLGHPSWKLRLAMTTCANSLLIVCRRSLLECRGILLDFLLSLLGDMMPVVSESALRLVSNYSNVLCEENATGHHSTLSTTGHHSTSTIDSDEEGTRVESLEGILTEKFSQLLSGLPTLLRQTAADVHLRANLRLLCGYLQLLGPAVSKVLHSHLTTVANVWVSLLEMDCKPSDLLLQHCDPTDGAMTLSPTELSQPIRLLSLLRFIQSEPALEFALLFIRLLGYHGDVLLISSEFLSMMKGSRHISYQCALLLGEVMLGAGGKVPQQYERRQNDDDCKKRQNDDDWRKENLERTAEVVLPELLDLMTHVYSFDYLPNTRQPQKTAHEQSNSILLLSLLLKATGDVFSVAPLKHLMVDAVFPLFEKLGHSHTPVSLSAHKALWDIVNSFNLVSLGVLINISSEYLLNSVSLSLRRSDGFHSALAVLRSLVRYGDAKVLLLLESLMIELLASLPVLEDSQLQGALSIFLHVLRSLENSHNTDSEVNKNTMETMTTPNVPHVTTTTPKIPHTSANDDLIDDRVVPDESLIRDLVEWTLEYRHNKELLRGYHVGSHSSLHSNGDTKDGGDDNGNNEYGDCDSAGSGQNDSEGTTEPAASSGDREKETLPTDLALTAKIMKACVDFQSHSTVEIRILVLKIMSLAVCLLENNADELLPLVHTNWASLSQRFNEGGDIRVMLEAFRCLTQMARTSGDFLRKRLISDIFPNLLKFLSHQSLQSSRYKPTYIHTLEYRLQREILSYAGSICKQVGVFEVDIERMLAAVLPYLKTCQPPGLQKVAKETVEVIFLYDPDQVWLKTLLLSDQVEITSTSPLLPTLVLKL